DPFLELLEDAGLKLGLWFDTWGMRVIGSLFPGFVDDGLDMLDNLPPNMERLARSPAIGSILRAVTRIAGRTKKTVPCLLEGDYPAKLRGAWEYWVGEQKCQLLKLDFTRFACNNPYHDHLPGKYSEELAVQVLAGLLAQARVANPDLVVLAYNGFTDGLAWLDDTIAVEGRYPASPWWLTIVDMLYCGDPRPANVPVPLFRSAITCYTDYQVQLFHRGLLPWRGIDDSGVLVGQTGTIYHLGKEGWRDAWVMSLCRGHLNPMIYGDLTLFDDADVTFLKATWDLFNAHVDMFAHPTPVGGNPAAGDIYGWACESTEGSGTFVALHNPGFLPRTFLLGDLGGDGWRQIYPGNTPVEFATEVPLGPSAVVLLARGFEEALPELRGEALYANGQALPIFIDKCHRYPQRRRYEGWIRLPQLAASEDFFVVVEFSKALYPWRKIMQPRTEVVISVESKDKQARVRPVAPGKVWSAVSWVAAKVECSVFATPATATIKIEVPWETGVRYLISCYLLSRYL
ncbi:MAG TPA: hypothetical protein VKK79_13730, partial [Candidatus Lokiarchaeia archaeon]|nr:hypothetical protein [Candidatus Lokiarchaeia archaeon]